MTTQQLKRQLLEDIRVALVDEFDQNFRRKGFFGKRWTPRRYHNTKGSLLVQTGNLRRSIKASLTENGVRFTSAVPYAALHNEGLKGTIAVRKHLRHPRGKKAHEVKSHFRRVDMPERRFIGGGKDTDRIISEVVDAFCREYETTFTVPPSLAVTSTLSPLFTISEKY